MADTPDDDVSYDSRRGRGYSPPPPRTQRQPQQPAHQTALDGTYDQRQSPSSRALKKQTEQRLKTVEDQSDTTTGNVRKDGGVMTARTPHELPLQRVLLLNNGVPFSLMIRGAPTP